MTARVKSLDVAAGYYWTIKNLWQNYVSESRGGLKQNVNQSENCTSEGTIMSLHLANSRCHHCETVGTKLNIYHILTTYFCIYCRYILWSTKGPLLFRSPSLPPAEDVWLCCPVEGLLEFWSGYGKGGEKRIECCLQTTNLRQVCLSRDAGDESAGATDETSRKADGGLTAGPALVSWGLLPRLRGGLGELGGVREAHTRWSMWYSSCCRSPNKSASRNVSRCWERKMNGGGGQPFWARLSRWSDPAAVCQSTPASGLWSSAESKITQLQWHCRGERGGVPLQ